MTNAKELKSFIDIFSGCGGMSLGAMQAGLNPVMAIEIDKSASETYTRNISEIIVNEDIRLVDDSRIPECDILFGGFPCQPFSLSGLQKGFDGKDGDLFAECLRFIKKSNAKAFVLENVTGFLRLQNGYWMAQALAALEELGYSVSYKILNTAQFGLPQKRERLFIVGNRYGYNFDFPQPSGERVTVKDAIDDLKDFIDVGFNHEPMKHTQRIKARFAAVRPGETARDAMDRDKTLGEAKITKQCYRRLIANEPAPTVVANFVTTTIHYELDRNLTAREAARLQGFPDSFVFCGLKTRMSWQLGLSQFEQIGNAVPPPIIHLICASLIKCFREAQPAHSRVIASQAEFPFQSMNNTAKSGNPSLHKPKAGKRGRKSSLSSWYDEISKGVKGDRYIIPVTKESEQAEFIIAGLKRRGKLVEVIQKDLEFHVHVIG